jgi:hypothetical protein
MNGYLSKFPTTLKNCDNNLIIRRNRYSIFILLSIITSNILGFTLSKLGIGYPIYDFLTKSNKLDDFENSLFDGNNSLYLTVREFILFPFGTLVYKIFTALSFNSFHVIYIMIVIVAIIFIFYLSKKIGPGIFGFLIIISSYPFIFAVSRGNNEIILFPLIAYIWFVCSDRLKIYLTSIANSIEPTPNHVVGLIRNKYDVLKFILIQSLFLIPTFFLTNRDGEKAYLADFVDYNLRGFDGYAVGNNGLLNGSSFNGLIKACAALLFTSNDSICNLNFDICYPNFSKFIEINGVVSLIVFIMFLVYNYKLKFKLKFDNSEMYMISSLLWILFAPVSADYRQCYLLISIILLLKSDDIVRKNKYVLTMLVLIIIQKNFVYFILPSGINFSLSTIINPILMLILLYSVLKNNNNKMELTIKNNQIKL